MSEYHNIFIPFIDIYQQGGPNTFKELPNNDTDAPNLIVYPAAFNDGLDVPGRSTRQLSEGEKDVQLFLMKAKEEGKFLSAEEAKAFTKGKKLEGLRTTIYTPFDNIHVAYFDHEELRGDQFSMARLEERVRDHFKTQDGRRPTLLSTNPGYHLKYTNLGIRINEPKFLMINADIVNRGTIVGNDELYAKIQSNKGIIPIKETEEMIGERLFMNQFIKFISGNEYAIVKGDQRVNEKTKRIYHIDDPRLELIRPSNNWNKIKVGDHVMDSVLGIKPRDFEQYLALQYGLFNPDVSLFFLCGKQGSGKTILAYAAAIDKILAYDQQIRKQRGLKGNKKEGFFERIILLKPTNILGGKDRDVGFMPGTLYDKLKPHLKPYEDAHNKTVLGHCFPFVDLIYDPKFKNEYGGPRSEFGNKKINGVAYLPKQHEVFEVVSSGFMRGRSLDKTLFLIDEAQNFTPYELKTIISRVDKDSAAIVMGDPLQHDNPNCSQGFNGLTYCIKNFLPKSYSSLLKLTRNYRHPMSADTDDMHVYSTS